MTWSGGWSSDSNAIQVTARRFLQTLERRNAALRQQNWAVAESILEEEVRLGRQMLSLQPTERFASLLGVSLAQLGRTLLMMGANPEAEEPLEEAVDLLRRFGKFNAASSDLDLIDALVLLAEVYRGSQFYVPRGGFSPLTTVSEMRAYRRVCVANGSWSGTMMSFISEGWPARAEAPLREAVSLASRLARYGDNTWQEKLANALYVLGSTLVALDRTTEAAAPLREAEALFSSLAQHDSDYFLPWLSRVRHRLLEVRAASSEPSDRISALEAMLPQLRRDARMSDDERANGVTVAKSNARDRLRNVLGELRDLYEDSRQVDKQTEISEGELGYWTLMTESLRVRLD
jgi:tetratricopeptide (TPR) repeat protein